MRPKRALMACSNDWDSPFQVGSHHLARGLVRAGYDVAFVSDPISPLHLCRGWGADLRRRFAIYRSGGKRDLDGRLWAYVPGAAFTPHNKPLLRTEAAHRTWHRWCYPNLAGLVAARGFAHVDLLYIDSIQQSCWLDLLGYDRAVYRVADYNPHFEKYTPAARVMECATARRVDLVLYPSRALQPYAEGLGSARTLLLENGVDYEHFAGIAVPRPPEYEALSGPIAVYVGVIPEWFHFEWVRQAALQLPGMAFVLIGPDELARRRLAGIPNIHLLGVRPYATIPGFLQHASVGLMPFDVANNPQGVDVLQPQKLYAYLASGLPVVSADWKNVRDLDSPARLCSSVDQFVHALRHVAAIPAERDAFRRYAARFNWSGRVAFLLQHVDGLPFRTRAAA